MILDKQNIFDWQAALTASRASSDAIDLVNNRDIGGGMTYPNLKVRVRVNADLVSGGSSTLTIAFQGSTDGSNWDTYVSTAAIAKANLTANREIDIDWPDRTQLGIFGNPKQVRLNYTVGTTDFTGGSISAYVVLDRQNNQAYAPGVAVSN